MIRQFVVVIVTAFLVAGAAFAVAVDEKPLPDPVLEAQARSLMKEIRCLVCQNQSIEDSNADLARDLRAIVRERVALGDTPDNVRAYLVDRYGDWVLLKPPFNPSTYLLWASPLLALVALALLLFRRQQKNETRQAAMAPLSDSEKAELDKLLEGEQ
ncbi:cytochrome c-type biogenesis protein [Kordiimonas aquimaris]|uniref:cytochrome c-type biogenesis protein n=1 Tax=Kordiimonas aquimaris TaxID=707591 RepID=UPI0021D28B57|nr:cytochrome c-type biogenesis protein [Kordiimonas aquimaris]